MKSRIMPVLFLAAAMCFPAGGGRADTSGVTADIVRTRPLVESRRTPALIHLKGKGAAAAQAGDVRLHVIDPMLTDYHYIRPVPLDGDFVFTVTPRTACGYRVWAEWGDDASFRSASAEIPGAESCRKQGVDRSAGAAYEVGRYRFNLAVEEGALKAGEDAVVTVSVSDDKGRYMHDLEPVGSAYAHIVGFYSDFKTIASFTPLDKAPDSPADTAGPKLRFKVRPDKAGFIKVFALFHIKGLDVPAQFGLTVMEAENTTKPFPAASRWKKKTAPSEVSSVGGPDADGNTDIDKIMAAETAAIKRDEKEKEVKAHSQNVLRGLYSGGADGGGAEQYDSAP